MAQAAEMAPLVAASLDAFVVTNVDRCLALGAPPRLSGPASGKLRLEQDSTTLGSSGDQRGAIPAFRYLQLLQSNPHFENLWNLVQCVQNVAEGFLTNDYSKGIVHIRHLLKYKRADACTSEMTRNSRGGRSSAAREEQLLQTAQLFLHSGNLRQHCDLLLRAGRWERALALAPGVSLGYWRQLADRYSGLLFRRASPAGSAFGLACGQVERTVHQLQSGGQHAEALCAAQGLAERCFLSAEEVGAVDGDRAEERLGGGDSALGRRLVEEVCRGEAEHLLRSGSPLQAACYHLSMDDVQGSISKLLRGNELVLAAWLAKCFDEKELSDYALSLLLHRCDKMVASDPEWDSRQFGVSLMQHCKSDFREFVLVCFCSRQEGSASEIDALHHTAGFPSLAQCLEKADQLLNRSEVQMEEITKLYLLSSKPELALLIGLDEVKKRMLMKNWRASSIVRLLWSLAYMRPSRFLKKENREISLQLQGMCAYLGAALASVRKYYSVVVPLLKTAIKIMQKHTADDRMPISVEDMTEELRIFTKHIINRDPLSDMEQSRWERFLRRGQCDGLVFPSGLECGEDFVSGSNLPAHSDVNTSFFTSQRVRGSVFFLGDGRTSISLNEALMWAKVNPFSPLGGPVLINPF